ncbi:MAG: TRAP transporter TatT component family protein [Brevinematia bacterium]
MRRYVLMVVLILLLPAFAMPEIFKDIRTKEDAKSLYEHYKEAFAKDKNYENAWKLCAFARFYGFYFVKDKRSREAIFEEAKNAGEYAVKVNPDGVEGNYFLGVAYGSWAEERGVMNSLALAGPIVDLMTKVIKKNPSFRDGAGYIVRGRVYAKAPGWPISIGDADKAVKDFEMAIKYPNRTAYRYYSEFLISKGEYRKARELIEKGLSLPPSNESVVDEYEVKLLKELLEKVKAEK